MPQRDRLDEAASLADALPLPAESPALAAAVLRTRGAVARARGGLAHVTSPFSNAPAVSPKRRARRARSWRTLNTLGTSYASLGAGELARDALERARELAELAGHHASAAIAAGQLAVLALDAGRAPLAVRQLQAQRSLAGTSATPTAAPARSPCSSRPMVSRVSRPRRAKRPRRAARSTRRRLRPGHACKP